MAIYELIYYYYYIKRFSFQLVLISWMVTLNSCLIWQIISFIVPLNEYVCVYPWTTLGNIAAIRLTEDADFGKKIIFSDEAHIDLGGYVNKQNCRIWGTEYMEKPTQPKRSTVWWGFLSRAIIGSFFFENEQGDAVAVNGDLYRAMLNEFLFTKIEEKDIGNIWFQQHGATCHTEEATLDVLHPVFEDRIISRRNFVVWLTRSCDLTPLDYNLWTSQRQFKGQYSWSHLWNTAAHNRVGYCMASRGSHLNEIICIINRKDCTFK